jgi:hypothetical protein
MTNYKIDIEWAEEQLSLAGYTDERSQESKEIRNAVLLLALQFNSLDVKPVDKVTALELFNKLAQEEELVGREVQRPDARWTEFNLGGEVRPGATVRVRQNAYEGSAGENHNGMVGRFVAARGGQAIVQYANSSEGTGHRHAPDKLEVLVKK